MKTNLEFSKAIKIGTVCIFSYLSSYYMRNLLSVCTPEMLSSGGFNKEIIGAFSSIYFLVYAFGQLINGFIGDGVKAKNMTLIGLSVCGMASIVFAFTRNFPVQLMLFAIMGFALSMLRGPLVKTISENIIPKYARVCCVFFSFSSFAGPLIASLLTMIFNWKSTFIVAGISCVVVALCSYTVLSILEKQGAIVSVAPVREKEKKDWLRIFKLDNFVFYMFVGALVEISSASISFWLPTYLTEHLNFSETYAKAIFSGVCLVRSFVPFVALFILRFFKDDVKLTQGTFLIAALFFTGMWLTKNPYLNVLCFLVAAISIACASALLWSVYIPSQGKTGMVSAINGVLDFTGYFAASAANMVFSVSVDDVGWNGIILMWVALMVAGAVAGSFAGRKKR